MFDSISPTIVSEKSNIIQQIMLESEYKAPEIAPQPKIEGMEQEN